MAATTVVFGIGNLGAHIRVVTGWSPNGADLTYAELAVTVATSVALGGVLLWWMERRWPRSFPVWVRVATATAVLSAVPLLRLDVGADSKASLVSMHLLAGACAIGAQRAVRIRPRR